MSNALEILLGMEPAKQETREFEVKRLSEAAGVPVVFELKGVGYSRVGELKKITEDQEIHIFLAGVVSPDFKNREFMEKYGAVTPAELVKKLLLPGEIEDLSREVERLSGYRARTIEELKKK